VIDFALLVAAINRVFAAEARSVLTRGKGRVGRNLA
jgi:hypothetical protein